MLTRKLADVAATWHIERIPPRGPLSSPLSLSPTPLQRTSSLCRNCSGRELQNNWREPCSVLEGEMASRKEERKGNFVASAVIGAAGLALGWAALELGFGGILQPGRDAMDRSLEPKEVTMEDPAVLLVEQVPKYVNKHKDNRSDTQIEEDNIIEALNEGSRKDHKVA